MYRSMDWTGVLTSRSHLFCDARTRRDVSFPGGSRRRFFTGFTMTYIAGSRLLPDGFDELATSSRKPGPKASFSGLGQAVQ